MSTGRTPANISKQYITSPPFGTRFTKASYEIAVCVAALVLCASSGTDKWLDTLGIVIANSPAFQISPRGFSSRVLATRMIPLGRIEPMELGLHSQLLQIVPPFFSVSRPVSRLSCLARMPTAGRGGCSRRDSSLEMESTSTYRIIREESNVLLPGLQSKCLRKPTV